MGLFRKPGAEQRSIGPNGRGWHIVRRTGMSRSGIDPQCAEGIPQVVGVYNQLSWSLAQAPLKAYRQLDDGSIEELPYEATPDWIKKPNGLQTRFNWMEQAAQQGLYYGDIFILESPAVGPDGKDLTEYYVINYYDVRVQEPTKYGDRPKYFIGGDDVTDRMKHIAFNAAPGYTLGRSPIEMAKDHVLGALAAGTYRRELYENNMNLAGVIETKDKMSKEAAQEMGDTFYASHKAGAEGGTPIGVLAGATWKTVTLTPSDAEYVQSQHWDAQVWATLLCAPLFMLDGSAGSWAGTGMQVMNTAYLQFTLSPFAKRIEESLSELLPDGLVVKFDIKSVLYLSPLDEANVDVKLSGGPVLTPNEARKLRGYGPVDGGDELRMPMWMPQMQDVDDKAEADIAQTEAATKDKGKTPKENN